ncbi:MAG: putative ATP-grasp-modified RiPP [Pseudonocardiales bacterium]|nr:putative ATP-grasp-modified RiPP [Pseudonocardiales bacterium]
MRAADPQPLASVGMRWERPPHGPSAAVSSPATRPLALRVIQPARAREVPAYRYDAQQQVATDPAGVPLAPNMAKDWTTDGTHTDGDGGDNEGWGWEEV